MTAFVAVGEIGYPHELHAVTRKIGEPVRVKTAVVPVGHIGYSGDIEILMTFLAPLVHLHTVRASGYSLNRYETVFIGESLGINLDKVIIVIGVP